MPGFIQIQKQRDPSAEMLSRMMMQVYAMKLEDKHRDKAEQRQIAKEKRARAALEKFMKEPLNIKTQGKRAFLRTPKGWTELSQPKVKALVGEVREWADTHKGKIPTPQQLTTLRKQKAAETLEGQKSLAKFNAKLKQKAKEAEDLNQVPTWNQQRNLDAQLKATEQKLLDPDRKGDPRLQPSADFFNKYSSAKYVYIKQTTTKKGFFRGKTTEDWIKVPIPQVGGKRYTARDISETAKKYNMTIEEVLKQMQGQQQVPAGVNRQ